MACVDAKVRCATAIRNAGYELPHKRITVNLAPGDLRKEGAGFDLPIALGVLQASALLDPAEGVCLAAGELSLSGDVLPIRGVLPIALLARRMRVRRLVIPEANGPEAALVEGLEIHGVSTLVEAAAVVAGQLSQAPVAVAQPVIGEPPPDISEVRGQDTCKRA